MYVQSGCKSAIMLSILLAPKLTPNFQGLYVGKEYRGWSGGGGAGRVLLFVCYIASVPASSVYQMKISSTSAIQKKKKKKKKKSGILAIPNKNICRY